MKYTLIAIATVICTGILSSGCEPDLEISDVTVIVAKSDCNGPDGPYTTETHSTTGGYTYLDQHFGPTGERFRAVAFNDSLGFLLADTSRVGLEPKEIYVIKSHEFHKIALFPKSHFDSVCVTNCSTVYTRDKLDNEARLIYDEQDRLIRYQLENPYVVNQYINVFYSDFEIVQGIEVAKKVKILQGTVDTFFFNFTEIKFNPEDFKLYEIQ